MKLKIMLGKYTRTFQAYWRNLRLYDRVARLPVWKWALDELTLSLLRNG
jgi:hypothetical protein